jgi:hypothetical protein
MSKVTGAESVMATVMRNKRLVCLLLASLVGVLIVWALLARPEGPTSAEVRVQVTGYVLTNGLLLISAIATNLGSETFVYQGEPPPSDIWWESEHASMMSRPKGGFPSSIGFLGPKGAKNYQFTIPSTARRIRAHCEFETLGLRGRLWLRLPQNAWGTPVRRLLEILKNVMPERRQAIEFWSEEILPEGIQ